MLSTRRMRGWVVGLILLLQCQAGPTHSAWVQVGTPELELLTSGDSRVAADAVGELAGLRAAWDATMAAGTVDVRRSSAHKVRVIAFSSDAEYQPFRINAFSPAYFVSGSGRDTIVLGRLTRENFPALRHEFVHHLVNSRWKGLPLWLDEGLADYFGGVDAGVARARAERLQRKGLLSLSELTLVLKSSASYQEREAALQFYAQSWALAHMLMTDPAYSGKAWALVDRLNGGASLENAIEGVFARSGRQVELDLRAHLCHLESTSQTSRIAERVAEPSMAGSADVGLTLARLLLRKGDSTGAQRYLDLLAETSRDNPELWSLTGDIALKQGRSGDARSALQEALRLGSRDARSLKQLAVLEQNTLDSRGIRTALEPVLARLVDVDPDDSEARRALNALQAPR